MHTQLFYETIIVLHVMYMKHCGYAVHKSVKSSCGYGVVYTRCNNYYLYYYHVIKYIGPYYLDGKIFNRSSVPIMWAVPARLGAGDSLI